MATSELNWKPITPNVGARLLDFDAAKLRDGEADALRALLVDRKVLVARAQRLESPQYVEFMRTFGEPVPDDLVPHAGHPPELGILHIRPRERQTINFWHMDYSFRERPTPVLSLYARRLPPCGGDTLFANLEAAYAGLSDEVKVRIAGLEGEHKVVETQNSAKRFTPEEFAAMVAADPVRHPLVGHNPDNGRDFLFVNVPIYCRGIAGMHTPEGDRLLDELYRHAQRPEYHFRLTWDVDTLVVWENTHCLHYPVADYFPHERVLWRMATRAVDCPRAP